METLSNASIQRTRLQRDANILCETRHDDAVHMRLQDIQETNRVISSTRSSLLLTAAFSKPNQNFSISMLGFPTVSILLLTVRQSILIVTISKSSFDRYTAKRGADVYDFDTDVYEISLSLASQEKLRLFDFRKSFERNNIE